MMVWKMLGTLLIDSKVTETGCWLYWLGPRLDEGSAPPIWREGRSRRNLRHVVWELVGGEKVKSGYTVVTTCRRRMCWRPSHLVVKPGAESRGWFDTEVAPAGLLECSTCDGPLAEHTIGQCVPLTPPARPDPTMIPRRLHA
jgi:hypothetical protein